MANEPDAGPSHPGYLRMARHGSSYLREYAVRNARRLRELVRSGSRPTSESSRPARAILHKRRRCGLRAQTTPSAEHLWCENAVRERPVCAKRERGEYELTQHARKVLWIIIGPPPDHPEYVKWWTGRLVSVRKAREEGTEPEFAVEPPVPLKPA